MALTKISRGLLNTGVSDSSDATAITIDSSERIGIGTSSPAVAFHMTGNGFKARFDRTGSAGSVIEYANGSTVVGNVGVQSGGFGFGGGFRDPDLFITTGGNVGIGTTSPASKFHVKVGTDNNLEIEETGGDLRLLAINDARAVNVPMEFAASRFEFLTGNVGIQTSGTVEDPLVVSDSGASSVTARLINTNADANPANLRLQKLSGSPADGDYIGMINVSGENDASEETIFQSIDFISTDVSDGTEDGVIAFRTRGAGTLAERVRIDSVGNVLFGKTGLNNGTLGTEIKIGLINVTNSGTQCITANRLASDGALVIFQQDTTTEGSISVNGSTVSFNGFSGNHESSGIASDTAIGTVCSTIDELDTYVSGTKEGQTRTNHAKIKVSDAQGDSRVYGVLSSYSEEDNKPIVASVGIGSVLVTGACVGGDLLESNGDGTAKVQDDDIIRSKTIGKVTIGNSNTDVKLVSCVLYCG